MFRSKLALLFFFLFAASPVLAQEEPEEAERILSYHSDIRVNADASMDVTETIRVVALGSQIQRGIYRDFPTDYRTPWGFRKTTGFDVVEVLKDGRPEPHHTQAQENGTRLYIGEEDVMLPHGTHTYTIRYKTDRQLGFFEKHDELYWNVTGNGWGFPIEEASATVTLPDGISSRKMTVEGYTGLQGSEDRNLTAEVQRGGKAAFRTTVPLAAWEGLTIVVGWPKGIVRAPTDTDRWNVFLRDNRMLVFGVFGLLAILGYYLVIWHHFGRDPEKGMIIPLFEAPDKLSPAAVRYIWKRNYDDKVTASSILNLAVKKYLQIEDRDGTYVLKRLQGDEIVASEERALFNHLLENKKDLELKQANRSVLVGAVTGLKQDLKKRFEKVHFVTNRRYFAGGAAVTLSVLIVSLLQGGGQASAVGIFLSIWLSGWTVGVFFLLRQTAAAWRLAWNARGVVEKSFSFFGAGFTSLFALPFLAGEIFGLYAFGQGTSPWMLGVLFGAVGINIAFFFLLEAPTLGGRKVLDKIEGLRLYLGVAEQDRLNALHPPERTSALFEKFLPYALALDVEQEWAEKFTDVLAKAGRTETYSSGWYSGTRMLTASAFASSIGSSLGGAIASASVSPGSSSGGGGGGSSGGGGGGGGGGGW